MNEEPNGCCRRDVSDVNAILTAPETQDEGVWKYEHLRQFSMELNGLAVALQSQCQPETCTQMTATEQWIFLVSGNYRQIGRIEGNKIVLNGGQNIREDYTKKEPKIPNYSKAPILS